MKRTMNRRAFLRASGAAIAAAASPGLLATEPVRGFFATHKLPIGLQLYMLGDAAAADLENSLTRVARIGYRAIELPSIQASDAAQVRSAADKAGVAITSVHLSANPAMAKGMTVLDDAGKVAATLNALGCKDAVVPFPVLPAVKSVPGEDASKGLLKAFLDPAGDSWKRTAALLNERGEALRREGISLSYHNHDLEFLPVGKSNGLDILFNETDPDLVSFQVDIGWTVAGGMEPVAFLNRLSGRVRQLHVKDLRGRRSGSVMSMDATEVGSGIVDWKKVLPAAYSAGARQFYVEQEPPYEMDRFDAAAKSFAYLRDL